MPFIVRSEIYLKAFLHPTLRCCHLLALKMGKELYKALVLLIWQKSVPAWSSLQNCEPPSLKIFRKELHFSSKIYYYILCKFMLCINLALIVLS